MRPILMASALKLRGGIVFTPPPGVVDAGGDRSASLTISASEPVQWFWSVVGNLPSSSVVNGGTASAITFTLNNSTPHPKSCTITVTVGDNTWTVNLETDGTGGAP